MLNIVLVGLGGCIGSVLRYLLNNWIYTWFDYPVFPVGILIINVLGCLIIGFLGGLAESREVFSASIRIFLFIGMLGGFTTFSSFGYDTLNLFRGGQFLFASLNILLQVFLGLGAVWLGYAIARIF